MILSWDNRLFPLNNRLRIVKIVTGQANLVYILQRATCSTTSRQAKKKKNEKNKKQKRRRNTIRRNQLRWETTILRCEDKLLLFCRINSFICSNSLAFCVSALFLFWLNRPQAAQPIECHPKSSKMIGIYFVVWLYMMDVECFWLTVCSLIVYGFVLWKTD